LRDLENLLIVSHTPHRRRADGRVAAWGPTVQEIDRLATRFRRVRHVACLHDGLPPASDLPYQADNVELVPVPPSGGETLRAKLSALTVVPTYARVIWAELARADVVHVRGPAHVALVSMLLLPVAPRPSGRWIKYAGNWRPDEPGNPVSAFQRWWLERPWHRSLVTVNGRWPSQPAHVRTFYNPSHDDGSLERGRRAAAGKTLGRGLRCLYVGRLEEAKGVSTALRALAGARALGIDATLDLVGGDDVDPYRYPRLATELGIAGAVTFHGWLPRASIEPLYAAAHVLLFPSVTEGWPKVLSEGMAFGVVPVASAISSIPQYLAEFGCGVAPRVGDVAGFVAAVAGYASDELRWRRESAAAVAAAESFTFRKYLEAVDGLLAEMRA
jgi:glycosyltransferase involved in cell wall biosynthesis